MFGLRSFGRRDEPPPEAADAPRPTGSSLLGLKPGFARSSRPTSEDARIAATPLPPVPHEPAAGGTRMKQAFEWGNRAPRHRPEGSVARRSGIELSGDKKRARVRSPDWVLIGVGAFALVAAAVATVVVWNRLRGSNEQQQSQAEPPLASAPSNAASAVPPSASVTTPSADEDDSQAELARLREKAHATGRESPELRAWRRASHPICSCPI